MQTCWRTSDSSRGGSMETTAAAGSTRRTPWEVRSTLTGWPVARQGDSTRADTSSSGGNSKVSNAHQAHRIRPFTTMRWGGRPQGQAGADQPPVAVPFDAEVTQRPGDLL